MKDIQYAGLMAALWGIGALLIIGISEPNWVSLALASMMAVISALWTWTLWKVANDAR